MARVAVLGTGLLGAGFVDAALRRGDSVTVWNRTAARARSLEAHGAVVADDPAAAVDQAERVHLVLSDDAAVDAVLEAALPALAVPVIDHSTVSPAGVAERFARLGALGHTYLHAPVFMGPVNAREGTGMMLVAGPNDLVEPLLPALERMTGRVLHVGERPDLAAAFKLFGNAMLITIVAGCADVLAMARSLGVPEEAAIGLFQQFDPSPTIRGRGGRMARHEWAPASFELAMARKDVRLMLDVLGDRPPTVLAAVAARMDTLLADGHGDDDLAALGRHRGR